MEVIYRKCSKKEAFSSMENKGLLNGLESIVADGQNIRSEPHKWVTRNPRFAQNYFPRRRMHEHYDFIVEYLLVPGTLGALELDKMEGNVKVGPQGAYGIPEELIPWFNRRVIGVNVHNSYDFRITKKDNRSNEDSLLRNKDDTISLYAAFNPRMFNEKGFTENMNLNRMTWLKTSLLWTMWRSAWATKPNQEAILKIDVPEEYIDELYARARRTKDAPLKHPVLLQRDPDRKIVRRRWKKDARENDTSMFVSGDKTVHFGIRGTELDYFIAIAQEQISDITRTIKLIQQDKPEHPTRALYSLLDQEIYLKDVSRLRHLH